MTEFVGIQEVISALNNALWGEFQRRCLFHVIWKSGEAMKVEQTMSPYNL